jgi:hypothetical protein
MESDEIGFLKGRRGGVTSRAKIIHMHAPFLRSHSTNDRTSSIIPRIFSRFAGSNQACDLVNEAKLKPKITSLRTIPSALMGRALPWNTGLAPDIRTSAEAKFDGNCPAEDFGVLAVADWSCRREFDEAARRRYRRLSDGHRVISCSLLPISIRQVRRERLSSTGQWPVV